VIDFFCYRKIHQQTRKKISVISGSRGYFTLQLEADDVQTNFSFSCVCPVIDNECRHNIAKVAEDSRGDSRVDPQTILDNVVMKSVVNNRTDA